MNTTPRYLYTTYTRPTPHTLRTFIADIKDMGEDDDWRTIGQIFDRAKDEIIEKWTLIAITGRGTAVYYRIDTDDRRALLVHTDGRFSYESRTDYDAF